MAAHVAPLVWEILSGSLAALQPCSLKGLGSLTRDTPANLAEVGAHGKVGGQEDMIVDVAVDIAEAKATA
ncbi:hypothetical protein [Citreimonas salinaria]|uniref:hypothetical protein n=1 Tax=Citreimonas salinaria TaxID=321339 RepID=UPI003CCC15D1